MSSLSAVLPVRSSAVRWGPPLMVFARWTLAYLVHAMTAALLALQGSTNPWVEAGSWWTVYAMLIDLGCLCTLTALLRVEGLRIRDLVAFDRNRWSADLAFGISLLVVLASVAAVSSLVASWFVYAELPRAQPIATLPTWARSYSLTVWPVLWGFTEMLAYVGYALPRLTERFGKVWPAIALIATGWAGQQIALPPLFEPDQEAYRFLSSLPVAIVALAIFWRTKRIVPLMFAYVLMKLAVAASVTVR